MYQVFDLKKDAIIKHVELIRIQVNDLSVFELTDKINKLKEQICFVAIELNNIHKSYDENVKSEFREIVNSTLEYMKSIKYKFEKSNQNIFPFTKEKQIL